MSFFVKTSRPEDWQNQLAEPNKQWKTGHSAKALAYCWMEAKGFPSSVKRVFQKSEYSVFKDADFLAGFVEHKVPLPGGIHPSQNDILVLAKSKKDLVAIAVEGKVSEPFGETIEDWLKDESKGKKTRLKFLSDLLQLNQDNLQEIRYQLLHRTASAVIEAKRFNASTALMLVHSFSLSHEWFDDYSNFSSLFGITARLNAIHLAKRIDDVNLYLAWITGEKEYLTK
jgi:hypothetical protein